MAERSNVKRSRLMLILAILALPVMPVMPVMAADESASDIFDSLYGDEIKRVSATRASADDVALAQNLLKAVETAKGQATLVEVFCDNAFTLASRDNSAAGYDTAVEAMQVLAKYVPAKAAEADEKIIATLRTRFMRSTGDEKAAAGESLIDRYFSVAERFIASSDYAGASKEYQRAHVIARQIESPRLVAIEEKRDGAKRREEVAQRIALLQDRIANDASDASKAASRKELVLLYVVDLDDPAAAMPFAGGSGDEDMKLMVPLAAKGDAVPADKRLDLGDWYFKLSNDVSEDASKRRMLGHASNNIEEFLRDAPNASGIQKAKATLILNRVKSKLEKLTPTAVATNTITNKPTTSNTKPTTSNKTFKPGKPINVLKLVDTSQDIATGKWESSGSRVGVVVEGSTQSWLNIPVRPSGEYEVRFKFVKTTGRAVFKVYLPITFIKGSSSSYPPGVSATFGANDGKLSMLENGAGTSYYYTYYDETNYKNNPTLQNAVRMTNGKPYSIRITVKEDDGLPVIIVYLAGRKFIAWKGKPSTLPGYSSSSSKVDRKAIGIGVYNPVQRSTVVVSSFTVQATKGEIKKVRED